MEIVSSRLLLPAITCKRAENENRRNGRSRGAEKKIEGYRLPAGEIVVVVERGMPRALGGGARNLPDAAKLN